MKHSLHTDEFLRVGEYLVASNNSCFLILQGDGNLCLYQGSGPGQQGGALWCARGESLPKADYFAVMQGDGNFVVYQGVPGGPAKFVWGTGTVAPGGKFVASVENSGLLTVSTDVAGPRVLWASRQLRLLSYNTHIMEGSNIVIGATYSRELPVLFRDEERYHYIVKKIKESGADIVAFQEVWSEKNMDRLMSDLRPVYPHCQRGNSGALTKAGCGLVMASKYPFSAGDFYAFPGGEGAEGWATKGVVRATVEFPDGGGKVSVGISHCWTDAGGAECTNIRDIINHTIKDENPAIMMGDFNVHRRGDPTKFARMTAMLAERGAVDSWAQIHGTAWSDSAATDDQITNTLAQFFSPNRNTPNPDCLDYIYLRNGNGRSLRPIRAEVVRDWHYPTGEGAPAWYWVHEGTVDNLPTAATFGDTLCVVTRSADGDHAMQVALYSGATKRWNHAIIRDAQGKVVETHGAPGLVWFDNRLHLFIRNGLQVYKIESLDGKQWSAPQSQGANFQSSGGICPVVFRNTLYVFVRDPTGGAVFYHVWSNKWSDRQWVGVTTYDDISAAVAGDVLCVVTKDNAKEANKSSGVIRAVFDRNNKWEVAQVGNSVTCGAPGVTVRNGKFEVYFREANCGLPLSLRGGKIHRRVGDGRNWEGENRLELSTADVVCPVVWGDRTMLFFPFYHTEAERLIYKKRPLAHGSYPQSVELDASDHYPYLVDLVWPA